MGRLLHDVRAPTDGPARGEGGLEIPKGVEVVVTRYERGIAYVRPWEELSGTNNKETK